MSTLVTVRQTTTTTMKSSASNNPSGNDNNSPTPVRSYGITPPVSVKGPDPSDCIATDSLEETLRSYNYFESDAELSHRVEVMAKLDALVRKWIRNVSIAKNVPSEIADAVGGGVHTFGSYRLGVHSKGGDIDTLVIAPRHIDRTDFFTSFVECLRSQPEVRDLHAVEGAFVPVIKLVYDGIELDMLFARLALPSIPSTLDLKDDQLLLNLDHSCVRSLNGCRVADEILDLVPNRETFRATLRAIKLWAKKSGLYNNALGFFGGVAWAMLVARICQLYPNAIAATLVHKFFYVYNKWNWPTPVLLKEINDPQHGFTVWDSRLNSFDRRHLMPIITPAYPQQNSTHNVSRSTQRIIIEEFQRGLDTVNRIMSGKSEWKELFTGRPFIDRYKHFIILLLSAPDQDRYVEWSGLVESKIRLLIVNLERNPYIDLAHVNSEKYTPDEVVFKRLQQPAETNGNQSPESSSTNNSKPSNDSSSNSNNTSNAVRSMWIVGLQFRNANNVHLNLTDEIRAFVDVVDQAAANSNKSRDSINLDARYIRRRELSNILPKGSQSTQSPRPEKTKLTDEKCENLKRAKLDSTSSEPDSTLESDINSPSKRPKLDTIDESNNDAK
ncbi:unnamed protein product [Adineta ricciae]|uniref:Poly(A) polymerase n=1 Tax=Adineta ricciae TaxID=249248 RepID=A0A816E2B7_ADIRI|nr:unnamed protein product [Adineta ricciae]CAF1644359.1 unnamed protein product [Adineta ricciae]